MSEYKYWIVNGGSASRFAAKSAKEAAEIVSGWNSIVLEYGLPPTNRVDVVEDKEIERFEMELARREIEGDLNYFEP